MARACALHSVNLWFIPVFESYQKTLKMVSIASLLGVRHLWEVVENKPTRSLVVSSGRALNETPHLYVEKRWPRHFGNSNSQASAAIPSKK